ncbi:hypothetical protein, partial [Microbacterium sp. CFBP 8794]|uniref:hypothetical protein n=1 Tax=Microbacterium sp. CFBP 8794 TaxID=2775269 RepID=UPI003F881B3F
MDCISHNEFLKYYRVFLNEALMCVYRYMSRLCRDVLRTLRNTGRLHPYVSIAINDRQKSVQIVCVGGRIVRLYVFV